MDSRDRIPEHLEDMSKLVPTHHAELRMAQRNLSLADIHFVLQHGKKLHKAGAIFFYLRLLDIPESKDVRKQYSRLEGTTVVVSRDRPCIVTVYRNRQRGLRHIKQKRPYSHESHLL